jgi:hypothetical protein
MVTTAVSKVGSDRLALPSVNRSPGRRQTAREQSQAVTERRLGRLSEAAGARTVRSAAFIAGPLTLIL